MATATKPSYDEDDTLLLMALESGLFAAKSNAKQKITTGTDDSSVRTDASPLPPKKPVEDQPAAGASDQAGDSPGKSRRFHLWRS